MKFQAALGLGLCALASGATNPRQVTFYKDVLPVLQKNCQGCHRSGEAAPMALLTYEQARPWARSIREAVLLKRMPPWFADPRYGHFRNDRSLAQSEIDLLVAWADSGAKPGDLKDAPAPRTFVEGWNIGKPDVEFEMPAAFNIPAKGTVEYQYIVIPTNFAEDKWVQMAEVRPGSRPLVHHVIAFVRAPGSKWLQDARPGVPFVPEKRDAPGPGERQQSDSGGLGNAEFLVGYAPGTLPEILEPGRAKLIPKGADIVLQMHYTANGMEGTDKTRVGMIFSKEPPKERIMTIAALNNKFTIPANAPNHRVDAEFEFPSEMRVTALFPHMHVRGKDFEYRVTYPTGEKEILLSVPRYDFNWQLSYYPVKDLVVTKGTKIECTAHFDNSPNNPHNPDPAKEVKWGDQSWEEMMIGFMDVAFDAGKPVKEVFPRKQRKASDD